MTSYTKNKKVHKLVRVWRMDPDGEKFWVWLPYCKAHNKTLAYRQTMRWAKTTCKKCLEKKP